MAQRLLGRQHSWAIGPGCRDLTGSRKMEAVSPHPRHLRKDPHLSTLPELSLAQGAGHRAQRWAAAPMRTASVCQAWHFSKGF